MAAVTSNAQGVYNTGWNPSTGTPIIYPPEAVGSSPTWQYDQRTVAARGELIAMGFPLPAMSRLVMGFLKWASLGASTRLLGVGDQWTSNRFKLTQPTGWASCEAIHRFDGADLVSVKDANSASLKAASATGNGGNIGTGTAVYNATTATVFANSKGLFTCAVQVLVSIAYVGTAAPAGLVEMVTLHAGGREN